MGLPVLLLAQALVSLAPTIANVGALSEAISTPSGAVPTSAAE
jgi:hypothetical protein